MVGSQIAKELAKCGVGYLRLIDHDILEVENLARHVLDDDYVGQNKAEGMAAYLAQVPGLDTLAIPIKIDQSVSDDLLDQCLDTDFIISATDRQDVQRRIARSALRLGIEAIFPALYVEGGGEIVVQFDTQLPCFNCWDEFRASDRPLRGPTLLSHAALPVIYTALRLSLGLLDGRLEDREMFMAGSGLPLYQVFILNRFGTLESAHAERLRTCAACGGRRSETAPHEPAAEPLPQGQPPRGLALILVGIALLIGVLVLVDNGSQNGPATTSSVSASAPPESSPAESEAAQEARYKKLAEARIAALSFKCLDGDACHADPEGHSLPIFINGMDENLQEYLEQHGYKDEWADSGGGIDGQTIGPGRYVGQDPTFAYVAKAPKEGMPVDEIDTGASFGTGLLYEERGEHENTTEMGLIPWDVSGGEEWTIIWTLRNASGQVARQLEYSVNIVRCDEAAIAYCEEADTYDPNEPANKSNYTPPPAFP